MKCDSTSEIQMSGLRLSSSRSIFVPDRGLPTTKNGGSARVTVTLVARPRLPCQPAARTDPPRQPSGSTEVRSDGRRGFTPGPDSRKGGPRAADPPGPGGQPG